MGSLDGAETCELVGSFLLSQLASLNLNLGIYRDDGLAVCRASPRSSENTKKRICQIFKENGLRITIEANKQTVNFLDVTFNLRNNSYQPFTKPNTTLQYVHHDSNHPPTTTKRIPTGINKRLSMLSSSKAEFDKATPPYQKALDECGYNFTLTYEPTPRNQPKSRKRNNIIWYNPPYSKNVSTNIGHKFLTLIDKHFPKGNTLRKVFNKNNIKLSYSCMNNMRQIISNHNKAIEKEPPATRQNDSKTDKGCNCRKKPDCPLNGGCLQSSVVYQAKVIRKDINTSDTYVGLTEGEFKTRWNNHKASFRCKRLRNTTELSKHIWNLKDNNVEYSITWQILASSTPYNSGNKRCNLCLKEKLFIIYRPDLSSLNKRSETVSACRHRRKHLLGNT
ncbi:uncharacterized protein LOC133648549 [Entelurus aequoreus]|uniref:uncharacterized protein LOC133648549 n=1 Tax=Entelurus aequoreus TaxID=161455 RepID=UPI002B1D0216|nr:uncharacterized protein LOC133648549 [Entelurus aequoreus]